MERGRPRLANVLAAAVAICVALPLMLLPRRWFLRVEVAGESMTPALQPGDYLVLRRGAPPPGAEYGRIVATRDPRPEGDGRLLLKRIVGLPGESLRVGGGVQVNGRALVEPYAHGETPAEQHRAINRLEAGHFFLLGDHRGASTDSRDFGPVPTERIQGTAALRYWPPARFGRLDRPARRFEVSPAPRPSPLPFTEGGRSAESGNP